MYITENQKEELILNFLIENYDFENDEEVIDAYNNLSDEEIDYILNEGIGDFFSNVKSGVKAGFKEYKRKALANRRSSYRKQINAAMTRITGKEVPTQSSNISDEDRKKRALEAIATRRSLRYKGLGREEPPVFKPTNRLQVSSERPGIRNIEGTSKETHKGVKSLRTKNSNLEINANMTTPTKNIDIPSREPRRESAASAYIQSRLANAIERIKKQRYKPRPSSTNSYNILTDAEKQRRSEYVRRFLQQQKEKNL